MRTSVSAKRCPQCGKVTGLHTSECGACGHLFRTRFEESGEEAEPFDAVTLPRPPAVHPPLPRRRGPSPSVLAFLGAFSLVSVMGLAAWLAWSVSLGGAPRLAATGSLKGSSAGSSAASSTSSAASFATGARPTGRAEDLYARIEIAMSLYDVDQAAGGMGRRAHSSDPHVLLLSYDFPDQSVRVSLFRGDLTGDDYRVQAVALYHGNTLLHRHTDDE